MKGEWKTGILETVRFARESNTSSFYARKWRRQMEFLSLPCTTREDLLACPLRERTFKEGKGLVKMVGTGKNAFLVKWGLDDLAKEEYPFVGERPLVALSNRHEGFEKCLWFYLHDTLPLIGETNNLPLTVIAAERYSVDALISDMSMVSRLLPLLKASPVYEGLKSLYLLGERFGTKPIFLMEPLKTHYTLALPETGIVAQSCESRLTQGEILFHPVESVLIEIQDSNLIVTKVRTLITPIIRYEALRGVRESVCPCGRNGFVFSGDYDHA